MLFGEEYVFVTAAQQFSQQKIFYIYQYKLILQKIFCIGFSAKRYIGFSGITKHKTRGYYGQ